MVIAGLTGTSFTIFKTSTVLLWFFAAEVAYVILFPQLVCVLFFKRSNGYGAIMGMLVGFMIRLLCGMASLGLPAVIRFPGCTSEDGEFVQNAPVKTISMLSAVTATMLFSSLTSVLFNKDLLPEAFDVFRVKETQLKENENACLNDANQTEASQQVISSSC